MEQPSKFRTYIANDSVVFCKTKDSFGGLSNMCAGFPLMINGTKVLTSEALYQACRFPHLPALQKRIIDQNSPINAKREVQPAKEHTRPDWLKGVSVNAMRWSLRVKLVQNFDKFSELLLSTDDLPIVELSYKDEFWGAMPENNHSSRLVGMNVLGRLLMELREEVKAGNPFVMIEPMIIKDFLFLGEPIGVIERAAHAQVVPAKVEHQPQQLFLFDDDQRLSAQF